MSAPPVSIHPTAIVDTRAELGPGVEVGPYAIIGPHVHLGPGVKVGPHAVIEGRTTLGADCRVFPGACIGLAPQDLKYRDEVTWLEVGARTVIREYATLHLATEEGNRTTVGSDCLLMAYTHVAHNCTVGDRVILANSVNLAGHVTIEDWAIVGGVTPIHQFVRIGCHSMIGGGSRIPQDVAPYALVAGNPPQLAGLNRIGLERRGFTPEAIKSLKHAFRTLFRSGLLLNEAVARVRQEEPDLPEIRHLLEFVQSSHRGVTR